MSSNENRARPLRLFVRLLRCAWKLHLGFAKGYCRHIGRAGELEAMQAFWPDSNGKFPFDVGCDLAV
jgi:hypothetical protein